MYIYRGKLDFWSSNLKHATNEGITVMFPSEFRVGDPVYTCWQWSASGNSTNVPCWLTGTIDSASFLDIGKNEIGFYYGSDYRFDAMRPYPCLADNDSQYCRFDGTFSTGLRGIDKLSLVVQSGNVIGIADTLLVFKPASKPIIDPGVIVPRIYIGRLPNDAPYSVDELFIVVIPGGVVAERKEILSFWQWTAAYYNINISKDNDSYTHSKMANVNLVKNVDSSALFGFTTGYYTFKAMLNLKETAEQQHLTLTVVDTMKNLANGSTGPLTLELQDLGPPHNHRQPHGINDGTTVVTNDTNGIVGSSRNEVSSLIPSLVEMGSKVVELTSIIRNMKLELSEKIDGLEQAVQDQDGTIARLESSLEAAQGQIELLNAKLLETETAREKDRRTLQDMQEKLQRGYETELSDTPASEADDSDLHNQSTSLDLKVDESYNNQPTQWRQ